MEFELWLEFEAWTEENQWDKENAFTNIAVSLLDGRHYGINVWTYQFLQTAVKESIEKNDNLKGSYLIPPDLFVKELTRECVESTITDLLKEGNLEEILNESVFGIKFIEPWVEALDLPECGEYLKRELLKELSEEHFLSGQTLKVLAKRQDNDDVLFSLSEGRLVIVHLTWIGRSERKGFPRTLVYQNKKEFWRLRLKEDIEEFNDYRLW